MSIQNQRRSVAGLFKSSTHSLQKYEAPFLNLIANFGVEGDAHGGALVKHRSRVRQDPSQANLRQVHIIHEELLEELKGKGFELAAGKMGENISSRGIDLLSLPKNTLLKIGNQVQLKVTGLRNPCTQLNTIQSGLMQAVLDKDDQGTLIRKAGIMCVVEEGGLIRKNDLIEIVLPAGPHKALERV